MLGNRVVGRSREGTRRASGLCQHLEGSLGLLKFPVNEPSAVLYRSHVTRSVSPVRKSNKHWSPKKKTAEFKEPGSKFCRTTRLEPKIREKVFLVAQKKKKKKRNRKKSGERNPAIAQKLHIIHVWYTFLVQNKSDLFFLFQFFFFFFVYFCLGEPRAFRKGPPLSSDLGCDTLGDWFLNEGDLIMLSAAFESLMLRGGLPRPPWPDWESPWRPNVELGDIVPVHSDELEDVSSSASCAKPPIYVPASSWRK